MKKTAELSLAPEELHRLYSITMGTRELVQHDFLGILNTVGAWASVATHRLQTQPDFRQWSEKEREWLSRLPEVVAVGERLLKANLPRVAEDTVDPFVSCLDQMLLELGELYPALTIRVENAGHTPEHVVYPESSLFIVLNEIVRNSVKHATAAAKVLISWSLIGKQLVLCVEDNGPGLTDSLSDSYLDIWGLGIVQNKRCQGLRAVQAVVRSSSGLLLFRRSTVLGGTHVLVKLPVIGAWVGDTYQHFGLQNEY